MNDHGSMQQPPDHRRMRLYLILAILVALVIILVMAWALWQALQPQPEPALKLTPAAAPVDANTRVAVAGSGWPSRQQVLICLVAPEVTECSEDSIAAFEETDPDGLFQVDLQVGPLLAEGMTKFIAVVPDSGLSAEKTFRVLQSPGDRMTQTPSLTPGTPSPTPTTTPTIQPTPTAPVAFSGWRGEYYANPSLEGTPVLLRDDPAIAFNWGSGSPDPALPADGFSVRWSRQLDLPGRPYRFTARADDGVRLWIDGRLVIDEWQDLAGSLEHQAEVELAPGPHSLVLEYYENLGEALVELQWEEIQAFPNWRGEYYANADLLGQPDLVRNDGAVDFDWGAGSPAPDAIPVDGFSARWSRRLDFGQGTYRFTLTSDDGARLLVDGQLVIDRWQGPAGSTSTFDYPLAEGSHQLTVEFYEDVGDALVRLGWSRLPDETATPLPTVTPTWTPSATPTVAGEPTSTPTATPTPQVLAMTLDPAEGWAGTDITVTSSGWPPGITVQVALLEPLADTSAAQDIADTIVPQDGQVELEFEFPNQQRWLQLPQVQVILHDPDWRIRGVALFNLVEP